MKPIVLAAVIVALSSSALAGAAREPHPKASVDTGTTVAVMADASRLGATGLTSLDGGGHWQPAGHATGAAEDFGALAAQIDTGTVVIALGVLGLALSRPIRRAVRRHEQQRRATALASALAHTPRA